MRPKKIDWHFIIEQNNNCLFITERINTVLALFFIDLRFSKKIYLQAAIPSLVTLCVSERKSS